MPESELLYHVTEEDEIIGSVTREDAHTKGIIHRTVLFYVFDKEKRIYVSQRPSNKEFYPEYWGIALGGHVNFNETYYGTVLREAEEELGINGAFPLYLDPLKKRFDENDKENAKVYRFIAGRITADPREIKQGKFMGMNQMESMLNSEKFLPETSALLEIIKKRNLDL